MPEIFEPDEIDPWPPGLQPSIVNPLIGAWPNPNTIRVDGRFRWISDSLIRPIASRHVLKLFTDQTGPPFLRYFEWFYYDLEIKGPQHAAGESGTSRTGRSVSIDLRYIATTLPLVQSQFGYDSPGVRVQQTIRVPGDPNLIRVSEYPDITGPGFDQSRFQFRQRYLIQPWVLEDYSVGRDPLDQALVPGTWDRKIGQWFPVSECFDLSDYVST